MSRYSECPECEGAIMDAISDTEDKCPRCGYIEKELKNG